MKKTTIQGRLLTYNIGILFIFVLLTALVFNMAIRVYIEKDIGKQMVKIAEKAEMTALKRGPDVFQKPGSEKPRDRLPKQPPFENANPPLPLPPEMKAYFDNLHRDEASRAQNELFRFYFMLDRSLREPLSVLNANYVLLDHGRKPVTAPESEYFKVSPDVLKAITDEIGKNPEGKMDVDLRTHLPSGDYMFVIRPVFEKNDFGLSWIVVYSSLEKINQLQLVINGILLCILAIAGIISAIFSSYAARKIAEPFSALNNHLNHIASRNFGATLDLKVDDELKDFVSNINRMSLALAEYDKAQKTFLQNASHEFRTPLMSIMGHGEGIIYEVMEPQSAAKIIVEESKRMTRLVEDLLYLSRLEAIEENYCFAEMEVQELIHSVQNRMNIIADKYHVVLEIEMEPRTLKFVGDEEKLIRALGNLISNACRHATSKVTLCAELDETQSPLLRMVVKDDGAGFKEEEIPHLFERFYKGVKGDFGLGLAIAKAVVERHGGIIYAFNEAQGARVTIEMPLKRD